MADITTHSNPGKKAGVRRSIKLSTRVDLTPMVDLGFLLITFFIFTTTLAKPKSFNFTLPAKGDSTQTAASVTLNLILAANNQIYYYVGNDVGNQSCTGFSPDGIRVLIDLMQKKVQGRFGNTKDLVVLIRPSAASSYKNLIDILDELRIMNVKRYALMDEAAPELINPASRRKPC